MLAASTTVGFEAEWEQSNDSFIAELHQANLLPNQVMHAYHCDCETCDMESGYPLRYQRDSTVAAELVSQPYDLTDDDNRFELMDMVEITCNAAVQHDATPGTRAGFHVHARHPGWWPYRGQATQRDTATLRQMWAIMLTHPVLFTHVHQGRHEVPDTFNYSATQTLTSVHNSYYGERNVTYAELLQKTFGNAIEDPESEMRYAVRDFTSADRHSTICWNTRFNTVEFRLWRSTRSAWRMQLYLDLSGLLIAPTFADAALDLGLSLTPEDLARPEWLVEVVRNTHSDQLADLLEQQIEYVAWLTDNQPGTYAQP